MKDSKLTILRKTSVQGSTCCGELGFDEAIPGALVVSTASDIRKSEPCDNPPKPLTQGLAKNPATEAMLIKIKEQAFSSLDRNCKWAGPIYVTVVPVLCVCLSIVGLSIHRLSFVRKHLNKSATLVAHEKSTTLFLFTHMVILQQK
jgi:hypothetical protein